MYLDLLILLIYIFKVRDKVMTNMLQRSLGKKLQRNLRSNYVLFNLKEMTWIAYLDGNKLI